MTECGWAVIAMKAASVLRCHRGSTSESIVRDIIVAYRHWSGADRPKQGLLDATFCCHLSYACTVKIVTVDGARSLWSSIDAQTSMLWVTARVWRLVTLCRDQVTVTLIALRSEDQTEVAQH